MFKKVLVAEDHEIVNKGVITTLTDLDIAKIDAVQYCDDALLKIRKAILDQKPYELLITDLSFNKDHRNQKIHSGEDLIATLKDVQPNLKIIVFSIKNQLQKVRSLVQNYNINAYVCKGRRGSKELAEAIQAVHHNKSYLSPQVNLALSSKSHLEIDNFDINLVHHLSEGLSQETISELLKANKISPSSVSSIEKHLNTLKIQFKANNSIHLVSLFKDLGLI